MEVDIDYPLKKVVKGSVIALFGSVLGMFLVFLSRVMMARYLSIEEYGIFSLGYVILSVLSVVSLMGLEKGISRQIAFFSGKGDAGKVSAIIRSSLAIIVVASFICGLILFLLSDTLSSAFSGTQNLTLTFRLFAFGLPFFTLLLLLVAVYRGFDRADVKVYFSDVLKNLLFVAFIGVSAILQLSFVFVLTGFVLSLVVSCVGVAILLLKRPPKVQLPTEAKPRVKVTRELLIFSLPLLVSALFSMMLSWTDTIALGYFRPITDVGIYNAALPIAMFVPILLNGVAYIYLPVVSKLHAQKKHDEIRRMYIITTKWIFSLTYPLFLVLVLFPRPVLGFLFGTEYVVGAVALQILVIGFFFHTFLGLNASTLLSLGETKYLMGTSIATSLVNIGLNIALVPRMGIMGAALATSASLVLLNVLVSSKCYLSYRIHPFTRKYLSPILVSIPAILIIYTVTKLLVVEESIWLLPIFLVIFFVIYFLSVLLTKGFDREDLSVIASFERRLGVDFKNVKRILKRFL